VEQFDGDFETHITVRGDDPAAVEALRLWAGRHGLRFHHIVLDRGRTPSQPMLGRRGHGRLSDERAAAHDLALRLAADGFAVCRVKIEAAPDNRDVPATDAEAVGDPGRYFEHHVKLALDAAGDLSALTAMAARHDARLSRNARRLRDDGRQERFVTQRCHGVGRPTAGARLRALLAALTAGGYDVVGVEEEYVVYDSDPGVDAGWLDRGGAP
jgi:hypothetical protein